MPKRTGQGLPSDYDLGKDRDDHTRAITIGVSQHLLDVFGEAPLVVITEIPNQIGVEGYEKSDMGKHGRTDLKDAILVRNILSDCDTLIAWVTNIGGNTATSAPIPTRETTAVL